MEIASGAFDPNRRFSSDSFRTTWSFLYISLSASISISGSSLIILSAADPLSALDSDVLLLSL
ncbi:MAG: hypothetical protein K2J24_01360 [Muribaculaceae bacterium]|nr:hypothetical protein [Bacteroides sp.]MDE6842152.1 hypothetical protein [Muribaculaceae bacterium]MDE7190031.1 hypothetical protein [Muribaculaceae bacterium]